MEAQLRDNTFEEISEGKFRCKCGFTVTVEGMKEMPAFARIKMQKHIDSGHLDTDALCLAK